MKISTYQSVQDNSPRGESVAWTFLIQKLTESSGQLTKGGELWSPVSIVSGKRRRNENVEFVYCLVLDFDDGHDWTDFIDWWDGLAFVVHTTHSHTAGHPKWRAIFPLKEPVPGLEWPERYRAMASTLAGGAIDEACKDSSRMYYWPSHAPGVEPFFHQQDGAWIDANSYELPPEPETIPQPARTVEPGEGLTPGDDFDLRASWSDVLEPAGWLCLNRKYASTLLLWRRPGKKKGISARTGLGTAGDRMVSWSSSTELPALKALKKYAVYAILNHGGDYSAAAKALKKLGYGSKSAPANASKASANLNPVRHHGSAKNEPTRGDSVEPKTDDLIKGNLLAFAGASGRNLSHEVVERIRKFADKYGYWDGPTSEFFRMLKFSMEEGDGRMAWRAIDACESELARHRIQLKRYRCTHGEHRDKRCVEVLQTPRAALDVKNRQLYDIGRESFSVLLESNEPPRLFIRAGSIVTPEVDGGGSRLVPVMGSRLRRELSDLVDFVAIKGGKREPVFPPRDIIEYVEAMSPWPGLPELETLSTCPVVTPSGDILREQGYDWASKTFTSLPEPVPVWDGDLESAKSFIFDELLVDFPFAEGSSKAHALALMLAPMFRPVIDGPVPLHLIEAPTQGTGKSLLARVCLSATLGRVSATTVPKDEDEWRKQITAGLLAGSTVMFLDNLQGALRSESLAAVLTDTHWTGRLLGQTMQVTVPNTAVWVATANGARLSQDLTRRTLYIKLDTGLENPEMREGFKHPDVVGFAKANRLRILSALTALAAHWVGAGRPLATEKMGSFESWSGIIGGVLESIEVPMFLENRSELYDSVNDEHELWTRFVTVWRQMCGFESVSVKYLMGMLEGQEVLTELVGDKTGDSARKTIGRLISFRVGKVFSGFKISKATPLDGVRRFKLEDSSGFGSFNSLNSLRAPAHTRGEAEDQLFDNDVSPIDGGFQGAKATKDTSQVQNGSGFEENAKATSTEDEELL